MLEISVIRRELVSSLNETLAIESQLPPLSTLLTAYLKSCDCAIRYVVSACGRWDLDALYNGSEVLKSVAMRLASIGKKLGCTANVPESVMVANYVGLFC